MKHQVVKNIYIYRYVCILLYTQSYTILYSEFDFPIPRVILVYNFIFISVYYSSIISFTPLYLELNSSVLPVLVLHT